MLEVRAHNNELMKGLRQGFTKEIEERARDKRFTVSVITIYMGMVPNKYSQ